MAICDVVTMPGSPDHDEEDDGDVEEGEGGVQLGGLFHPETEDNWKYVGNFSSVLDV